MSRCDLEYRDCFQMEGCWCSCRPYSPPYLCCCTCPPGQQGETGADGKSAYQIALDNGFVSTESEWLDSLKGEPGPSRPFLSSYVEAVGNTQTIENGRNVVFDIDPDVLDITGNDIEIDSSGTTFTFNRTGLYHVEWSMNLASASQPVVVGLMEDGAPASALANSDTLGNYSSGALISVGENDLPYTVSLHNFGAPISIENPETLLNTAVSMRILRFADGSNE